MKIHVVHTINAFTATTGGTATCTYDLLKALNQRSDVQADILVTKPKEPLMGSGEEWIKAVENDEKTPFGISRNLYSALAQADADIFHTNGLWRYCNHAPAVVARQKRKPFVLTPHGMLYPEALVHSQWQKRLLGWACVNRDIREAACIHVTCEEEMQHIRALGLTNPVAIIPNPVPESSLKEYVPKAKKVTFGYLGRLHPRKHVERILEAVALLPEEEQTQCELVIMGSGEPSYEAFLRERVERLHLSNVHFLGFVEGVEKERQLAQIHALFVPSDFENFGMIVAEALREGTPVFASTGTPWRVLNVRGCGWWQEATPEKMSAVMRELLSMTPEKLDEMGKIGRKLVAERFSDLAVAEQMKELYHWILTKQNKPSFVYE